MRTKTSLLTAAVAAAGVASSMAQVYSVNTVGYVNVVAKGGAFTLVANPLDDGTNTISSIAAALPNKSSAQIWNGAGFTGASKTAGAWSPNLSIPVGTGFFVSLPAGANVTNTFVGTVIPNSGSSVTSSVPAGFSLVGTVLPVSGDLVASGAGTLNLGPSLPNKSSIQTWDNSGSGAFVGSSKAAGVWTPNQTINPGQGFFINSPTATNWVQSLP
jgi:hypothetical protein